MSFERTAHVGNGSGGVKEELGEIIKKMESTGDGCTFSLRPSQSGMKGFAGTDVKTLCRGV